MTNSKDIYLDIGDIYTKFCIYDNKDLEYDICFPTVCIKDDMLEKTVSYFKDIETETYYTVGWDAAYKTDYNDIYSLKSKAGIYAIINKILFDNIKNKSKITLHIIDNKLDEEDSYKNYLDSYLSESSYFVCGFVNNIFVDKEYFLTVKSYHASDILKNFFSKSNDYRGKDFIAVVDIGFKKTKVFLIDNKHENVTLKTLNHGFDYYLKKISENFSDHDLLVNPFLILKELEWGNTVVKTEYGSFDIGDIVKNAKIDLNTILTKEIDEILNNFYKINLSWPNLLYIAGGGAVFNGELIKEGLTSKYDDFKGIVVDENPRDYLLRVWILNIGENYGN